MTDYLHVHPYMACFGEKAFDVVKPFTWELNEASIARLRHHMERFAEGSAYKEPVHWLLSAEIEFQIHPTAADDSASAEELAFHRERITRILESRLVDANATQAEEIHARIASVNHDFTLPEMMMFDMYERLEDIVEFRFGKELHGIGYYDNEFWGEIRLKPTDPIHYIRNCHRAVETLHEVVKSYEETRLRFSAHLRHNQSIDIGGLHLNFSPNVVRDGALVSVLELREKEPEAQVFCEKALAGMLKAVYDSRGLYGPWAPKIPESYAIGLSRAGAFRLSRQRAEYRGIRGIDGHMALLANQILGGAWYGVERDAEALSKDGAVPCATAKGGTFEDVGADARQPFGHAFYTTRILQGSTFLEDGTIILPDAYLRERNSRINAELLGVYINDFDGVFGSPENLPIIKKIFEHVRVTHDGIDISALENWHPLPDFLNEFAYPGTQRRIDVVLSRLRAVTCKGLFDTIDNPGYQTPTQSPGWAGELLDFYRSPANRSVYGDALLEDVLTAKAQSHYTWNHFVNDEDTASFDRKLQMHLEEAKQFLRLLPASLRPKIQGAMVKGLQLAHDRCLHSAECAETKHATYPDDGYAEMAQRHRQLARRFYDPLQKKLAALSVDGPSSASR